MLQTAQNVLLTKKILESFPNEMNTDVLKSAINPNFVNWLCKQVQKILLEEPNVIETNSCVHIIGDIHGQFEDLVEIFKKGGVPTKEKYIFLGDYIDRGENSVEVMCLLFILKCTYPSHIILLRGNHESRAMTNTYGFTEECKQKLNLECAQYFCNTFDKMPLCAIVDKKEFCVHGGISKNLHSIKDIMDIDRFHEIPENGIFCDLLWSDPSKDCKEWKKSDRCDTNIWGLEPTIKFLDDNNLSIIIRGHQVVEDGYKYDFYPDKSVVTVFSSNGVKNRAAFMTINRGKPYKFTEIYRPIHHSSKTSNKEAHLPITKTTDLQKKNNNTA